MSVLTGEGHNAENAPLSQRRTDTLPNILGAFKLLKLGLSQCRKEGCHVGLAHLHLAVANEPFQVANKLRKLKDYF